MSIDKLNHTEDRNVEEVEKEKDDSKNIVTVFDIASEIEKALRDVKKRIEDDDEEFNKSLSNIEEMLKELTE
ncbi:Bil1p NDAI_0E00600 [Naumovozyma dairenensis CBS 421]|uniref:Uncharacterized protein n=1 Tax=Naumovozyma dairenensis (strain ATCC 10597 / BCRC 20456 / CBS 421 / NBRC 0211 / NRRL Y-12639) TaxID=1071378 RepID=G0WAV6_NAUDC|nr:hypothetical protein NDAI_0E00600 [Naumovozyma dairenensis CBS 421]CCD24876.1 hypothetical protein NDAI_0E00600 [Naumovozyma dairenensis CBS 421]